MDKCIGMCVIISSIQNGYQRLVVRYGTKGGHKKVQPYLLGLQMQVQQLKLHHIIIKLGQADIAASTEDKAV